MPECFEIYIVYKRRYINTRPFLSFSSAIVVLLSYISSLSVMVLSELCSAL